jgi:hypothetical protein
LMVVPQTVQEYNNWYPGEQPLINAHGQLSKWLESDSRFGIVNWQAFNNPVDFRGVVGAIIGDESSILKSRFGIIKQNFLASTRGIQWKMACTATPAPNDLEEYSNHAAFCGVVKNPQEFFSKYFTFDHKANTWRLRHHAKGRFYQDMATWANYMRDPANYGFHSAGIPEPTFVEIAVPLTKEQEDEHYNRQGGQLSFMPQSDGVKDRSKASQISRGFIYEGGKARHIPSLKPATVADLVERHDTEQSIVWVEFIEEGKILANEIGKRGVSFSHIYGEVPDDVRAEQIASFKAGSTQTLIADPSMLGFGLNFQNASVQVWSGITDSYEEFHQGVGRTVRYGAKQPTTIYLPVTDLERAVFENVLSKKNQFNETMAEQERHFITNMEGKLN